MSETRESDDDATLVRRIVAYRDQSALAELMARYAPKITGYLRRQFEHQLRHPEIDQAVNDAGMKLWENAHRFDEAREFGPWFLTIALRAALDVLEGESRQPSCGVEFDPAGFEESEPSPKVAWYVEQLEQVIEHELKGFEQIVARADLADGGPADTRLLMERHGKTKNVVQVTRSKVWKKIRETIRRREAFLEHAKVNQ